VEARLTAFLRVRVIFMRRRRRAVAASRQSPLEAVVVAVGLGDPGDEVEPEWSTSDLPRTA
jgi:hypothetical protein